MKKLLVGTVAVIGLFAVGLGGYSLTQNRQTSPKPIVQQQAPAPKITFSADKKTVSYRGAPKQTALATLRTLTKVETESSSYGDMVVGINGLAADTKSEYWAFYVNNKLANEGAGTYKAKGGDQIQWRLEKL